MPPSVRGGKVENQLRVFTIRQHESQWYRSSHLMSITCIQQVQQHQQGLTGNNNTPRGE
jgi:hypothetical protein